MQAFFKRNTKNRGEGRELYFTPFETIEKIVNDLLKYDNALKNRIWVDVCAGDGRWANIIKRKGVQCESYDIAPLNDTVKQQDFLNMSKRENIFILGNPPFSLLLPFVYKALIISDMCYFLGGSQIITGSLSRKAKMLHRFSGYEGNQKDQRSKLIFKDTLNQELLIWCCGGLFTNKIYKSCEQTKQFETNSFRVSIQNYCIIDDRIRNIKK